ncbi:MAG: protein SCO1/2 [Myxococcota bacterium]|jgi:protein SCO1/2
MRYLLPFLFLSACNGANEYIVEGTVYEKPSPTRIIVNHKEILNFMPAMTMPFDVRDASLLADVDVGDTIIARLEMEEMGAFLEKVRVTGTGRVPDDLPAIGTDSVLPGAMVPAVTVPLSDGTTTVIGEGQAEATAITFTYTRCPIPNFCPLTMSRMTALQEALGGEGRIVVVTLDPEHDTAAVLSEYAVTHRAQPSEMMLGRLEIDVLAGLAKSAGLSVDRSEGEVLHGLRLMITRPDGTLVERYDDNRWSLDRVVSQLKTGEPSAPPGSEGTMTAPSSGLGE